MAPVLNDSIDPNAHTLSYCSVCDAFAIVSTLGKGTLMAKIDFKKAFYLIPVRPEDWNLHGIYSGEINSTLTLACHSVLDCTLPVQSIS